MAKKYESIKFDYNNMMADYVGAKEGISAAELAAMRNKAVSAHSEVKLNRGTGQGGPS